MSSPLGWTRKLPGNYPLMSLFVAAQIVFLMAPTLVILLVSLEPGTSVRFPPEELTLRWYLELPEHPFFFGTQFHPEFRSRPGRASPPFLRFVETVLKTSETDREEVTA